MARLATQEEVSEERRRLKSQLRELQWAAWLAGTPALLYCGDCDAAVSCEKVIEGPLQDWPYCPVHENKPLTIHSALPPEKM